jgi:hypothetical protein
MQKTIKSCGKALAKEIESRPMWAPASMITPVVPIRLYIYFLEIIPSR